jgi:uncharacterized membrane protein
MRHKIKEKIYLFIIIGCVYLLVELFYRALSGSMVETNNIKYMSLVGWTSLWMLPIGGISGLSVGILNEYPKYIKLKIWQQCILGSIMITFIELISGIVFNIVFNLGLWDYSNVKYNILGQISLPFSLAWIFVAGFSIWVDDTLRYLLFKQNQLYSLWELIKECLMEIFGKDG